jgi:hypothetical protein
VPFLEGATGRDVIGSTTGRSSERKVFAGLFSSLDGVVETPDQWQPSFDEEMGAGCRAWSTSKTP